MMERKVQLVHLGTGDAALGEQFAALATRYPGRVSAQLRFDDATRDLPASPRRS